MPVDQRPVRRRRRIQRCSAAMRRIRSKKTDTPPLIAGTALMVAAPGDRPADTLSWTAADRQQQFIGALPPASRIEHAQPGLDIGPGRIARGLIKLPQYLQDRARRGADEI